MSIRVKLFPALSVFGLLLTALLSSQAVYAQNAPTPTHVTATVGPGSATLTWDDMPLGPPPPGGSRFTGYYNVYRATTRGAKGTTPYAQTGRRTDRGAGRTTFTDTHVSPGTTYYYQVTSVTVVTVTFPNLPTETHNYESARSAELKAVLQAPVSMSPLSGRWIYVEKYSRPVRSLQTILDLHTDSTGRITLTAPNYPSSVEQWAITYTVQGTSLIQRLISQTSNGHPSSAVSPEHPDRDIYAYHLSGNTLTLKASDGEVRVFHRIPPPSLPTGGGKT